MSLRVSVVLCVYNGENYVSKAIDSVLNQEYPAHEVLVVDDGSSDRTPEILERYKGRIKVHRLAKNAGLSNARNMSLGLASGDVLAYIDHDDVWFRNYLKTHVEAMSRHPEAGLSCSNYVSRPADMKGRMVRHFSKLRSLKGFRGPLMTEPFRVLFQECFIGTPSSVVFKKELAEKVGSFNERYRICQDYDYWLKASILTSFIVLDDILLFKRVHGANMSGNMLKMMLEYRKVQEDTFWANEDWIRRNGLNQFCRLEIARGHYFLGDLVFSQGHPIEFFRHLLAGLRSDRSGANLMEFSKRAVKKIGRIATFDALGRKR